jgi:hypothetical protein
MYEVTGLGHEAADILGREAWREKLLETAGITPDAWRKRYEAQGRIEKP